MKNGNGKVGLARLFATEAAAYVRSGLLAPGGARSVRENVGRPAELGVLFVPGVGANASQFAQLKLALRDVTDWFDAFEYSTLTHPERIAKALRAHIDAVGCARVLVIGHSMGGLLLRVVLQDATLPANVAGFVSICAPLHGTWRSRLAPNPRLRALAPDSPFIRGALDGASRLTALRGAVLAVGARYDQFVTPWESAFLDGHDRLELEDGGHVASLFDRRVHDAIVALASRVKASRSPTACPP